jgi:uncharacterized lipoprotein YehR (DUF1307 family)
MAMKLEATKELVEMIEQSAREWRLLKSHLEEKHHKYDTYAKDNFGIEVEFSALDNAVIIHGATVLDEEKYITFLLKYGDMHDE